MMAAGNGQLAVPPGFRFHPTDEELLYYYLRKKVSYEPIDLDVIREVDLNKLEPWDLKEKCRIGSGPQNEWYFFSHKDKKYPTGTRTNRATAAGFWKATGRDKAIHLGNSKRIGMRKTLVFYTGRAPHGQKTEWIMHEYRLEDHDNWVDIQEDGWVVCRVFKKKNHTRGYQPEVMLLREEEEEDHHHHHHHHHHHPHHSAPPVTIHHLAVNKNPANNSNSNYPPLDGPKQNSWLPRPPSLYDCSSSFDGSMHLPQLLSPESSAVPTCPPPPPPPSLMNGSTLLHQNHHQDKFVGDWSFLDKLLASHNQNHDQILQPSPSSSLLLTHHQAAVGNVGASTSSSSHQRLFQQFQYPAGLLHGCCQEDILKYSK